MTDYSPRRRGRPPATGPVVTSPPPASAEMRGGSVTPSDEPVKLADVLPNAVADKPEAPSKRRRRTSVGGIKQKLSAPARSGYVRRWFNDDGNRLAEAEELGYDHVQDTGLQTSSPGSRVSRLVGTKANGEPLHAFLMETPEELYAQGVTEKEAVARQVDEAITRGKATSDGQMSQIPESETYGHGEIRSDG